MTEREALAVLIRAVDWLDLKQQNQFIDNLDTISDEDVRSMGKFFTTYLKAEKEDIVRYRTELDQFLKNQAVAE